MQHLLGKLNFEWIPVTIQEGPDQTQNYNQREKIWIRKKDSDPYSTLPVPARKNMEGLLGGEEDAVPGLLLPDSRRDRGAHRGVEVGKQHSR